MKEILNNSDEFDKLPKSSGLYYFFNENNQILYIGKASNLKSRIVSHQRANKFHREGLFFRKMIIKNNLGFEESKWPQDLQKAWADFQIRGLSNIRPTVIDYIFHKISKIGYKEISKELTKIKEKEEIEHHNPPFNSQTASEEYFRVQEDLE